MKASTYVLGLLLAIAPHLAYVQPANWQEVAEEVLQLLELTGDSLAKTRALADARGECIDTLLNTADKIANATINRTAKGWENRFNVLLVEMHLCKERDAELVAELNEVNAALAALPAVGAGNARPEANNTDVSATYNAGNPPLIEAVEAGSLDQVRRLLEAGEDVNTRNSNGETPLHWAEDANVMRLLLEAGADVNARDSYGDTPLQNAVFLADDADVVLVQLLLEAGADVNTRNNDGDTPLQWAEHAEVERLLRKAGAK